MGDNQANTKGKVSGRGIALLGAGATVLAVLNMSTDSEAQSSPVLVLQYTALALGLLALFAGLIMMMTQRSSR